MLVPPESSSAVLVMIRSKFVSICNHYRARLVDSSINGMFSRRYTNLMRSYGGLLEPRGSNLTPLKSTFNAEHFVLTESISPILLTKVSTFGIGISIGAIFCTLSFMTLAENGFRSG